MRETAKRLNVALRVPIGRIEEYLLGRIEDVGGFTIPAGWRSPGSTISIPPVSRFPYGTTACITNATSAQWIIGWVRSIWLLIRQAYPAHLGLADIEWDSIDMNEAVRALNRLRTVMENLYLTNERLHRLGQCSMVLALGPGGFSDERFIPFMNRDIDPSLIPVPRPAMIDSDRPGFSFSPVVGWNELVSFISPYPAGLLRLPPACDAFASDQPYLIRLAPAPPPPDAPHSPEPDYTAVVNDIIRAVHPDDLFIPFQPDDDLNNHEWRNHLVEYVLHSVFNCLPRDSVIPTALAEEAVQSMFDPIDED